MLQGAVFYTDNSNGSVHYAGIAYQAITSLGVTANTYASAGLNVSRSNIDTEIRNDFHQASAIVILLGVGSQWKELNDNWALGELPRAGIPVFVYLMGNPSPQQVQALSLTASIRRVGSDQEFEALLRQDLSAI